MAEVGEPAPATRQWLFGPGSDLLLGCGLGSIAIMVIQAWTGPALARWVPGALIILLFALPHYGATLVRVYEDPADRRKYRFFSVWATALVGAAFIASIYGPAVGSIVLTVYLTWSPWHYTGQNYGIALMMLARRGVVVSGRPKRVLQASFLLSYGLTFLALHGVRYDGIYAPVSYGGTVLELLPIGIPHSAVGIGIAVVGAAYLLTLSVSIVWLLRKGGLAAALPCLVLMATQALWFSIPVPIRHWDLAAEGSVFRNVYTAYGFLLIAGAHSLQYLWITTYYGTEVAPAVKAKATPVRSRALFLGKATLLGYAVWTLPALIFAPGVLGRLPHESGLALIVAAVVNLHHFLLDGAVWKLRDGRVARVLLGISRASPPSAEIAPKAREGGPGGVWLRRSFYGLGALCAAYGMLTYWGGDFGFTGALSRGDNVAAREAVEVLRWLGRDGPAKRTELGRGLARSGSLSAARTEFERSLELQPTARAWQSLGQLSDQQGNWSAAATAYDSALALEPGDGSNHYRAGRAWLAAGRPDLAVRRLERAVGLVPDAKVVGLSLEHARRELAAARLPD